MRCNKRHWRALLLRHFIPQGISYLFVMHNCSHSRQQINLFIHVAVIPLHIWSWRMWSQTIKIIIMDTAQLGGHLKNGSEVTSAHLFIFIGVSMRVTNLIYLPLLLRVQDPDIQIWSGTLLRISNALLIHPLSYWHLGGNPSFLFLSFLALQPLVYLRVRVCGNIYFPSSSVQRGRRGVGRGGSVMVIIFLWLRPGSEVAVAEDF